MNTNPYATPDSQPETPGAARQLYVVSPAKFAVMYIGTLGIYMLYWLYRNWRGVMLQSGEKIWPVARAIFGVLYIHALFARLNTQLESNGQAANKSLNNIATVYVLVTISTTLLDQLASDNLLLFSTLLSLGSVPFLAFLLLPAQRAINLIENDPLGETNRHFRALNILWIAFGLLVWAMVMLGLYALSIEGVNAGSKP